MNSFAAAAIGLGISIAPLLPSLIGKRERPTRGDYAMIGAASLLLAATFYWLAGRAGPAGLDLPRFPLSGWAVMALFCILYGLVLTWLAWREIDCFVPDIADLSVFAQGFWTTRQGAFFFSSLTANDVDFVSASELLKGPRTFCLFGNHNSPILLLLLPFYWLRPSPYTLVALQSVALSAAPLVLYGLLVGMVGEAAAVFIALAFALSGPMIGSFLLGWHEMSFAVVPLLLAYHYFEQGLFWPFLLAMTVACMIKENVALSTFLFGPLALLRGYSIGWGLAPSLISLIWFVLSIWVIIPHFGQGRAYVFFGHCYKAIGGNLSAIAHTLLLRPHIVLKTLLRRSNLKYLYQLLFPYGLILPFCHSSALLSLAGLGQVLLSDGNQYALPYKYYSIEAITFMTIGFAGALARLAPLPSPIVLAGSLAALALTFNSTILWSRGILWSEHKGNFFKKRPNHSALSQALRLIPPDAAALVPLSLVTQMAGRTLLGQESWNYEPGASQHYEYIVLDRNDPWRFGRHDKMKHEWLCKELAHDTNLQVIYEQDNVQVFRRTNYMPVGNQLTLRRRPSPG